MATFNDPNYMGFFYSIGVFATMTLKLFKTPLQIVIVILLYVMIAASLSITAILGNILFWVVYLFAFCKVKFRTIFFIGIAVFAIVNLYNYGLSNPDAPIIGNLSARIVGKISALEHNDINSFTTSRAELSQNNLHFFLQQTNPLRLLFGGYKVNALVHDPFINGGHVAHNEYIDLLLNVGLIGSIIFLTFHLIRLISSFKKYRENSDPSAAFVFMIKTIWLYYSFGLTLFLEPRFFLFFFI